MRVQYAQMHSVILDLAVTFVQQMKTIASSSSFSSSASSSCSTSNGGVDNLTAGVGSRVEDSTRAAERTERERGQAGGGVSTLSLGVRVFAPTGRF